MRPSLIHPLGTMSHGVREGHLGDLKKSKIISTPEREDILISGLKLCCGSR
jgi:hypothetical protein